MAACDLLQATEGNDADAAAAGPSQADETVLGAATGSAAAGIAAAAGGLAVALGGREQPVAAAGVATPAAAPAAAAPVPAKAPEIDLLGGDDVYVSNGERTLGHAAAVEGFLFFILYQVLLLCWLELLRRPQL